MIDLSDLDALVKLVRRGKGDYLHINSKRSRSAGWVDWGLDTRQYTNISHVHYFGLIETAPTGVGLPRGLWRPTEHLVPFLRGEHLVPEYIRTLRKTEIDRGPLIKVTDIVSYFDFEDRMAVRRLHSEYEAYVAARAALKKRPE